MPRGAVAAVKCRVSPFDVSEEPHLHVTEYIRHAAGSAEGEHHGAAVPGYHNLPHQQKSHPFSLKLVGACPRGTWAILQCFVSCVWGADIVLL